MENYCLPIVDIIEESSNVKTYVFEAPSDFVWDEGSSMHVGLPGYKKDGQVNKDLVHHMSVCTLPSENKLSFTTRFLENGSVFKETLKNLKVGDEVNIFKFGSHMALRREDKDIVFISMGVAISTIRPLLYKYLDDDTNIGKIISVNINSSEEYIYKKEIDALENKKFDTFWINNREDFYAKVNDLISDEEKLFYVVGNDAFLVSMIHYLEGLGVARKNIIIDKKPEKLQLLFEMVDK